LWAFNDPENEIRTLSSYLDGESQDIEYIIRLHSDTYPFIAVEEHHTDLPVVKRVEAIQIPSVNPAQPHTTKELPLRGNESSHRSTPTVLVPTLALGSLYMLSKFATKDQGDT